MNRSPLRRLAADYADGRLPGAEYRRRRRELIDDMIASGRPIPREAPSAGRPPAGPGAPARTHGIPLHWVFGGAAGVCVLLLAWLLLAPEKPPPAPAPAAVVAARPAAPSVPRSRALVESFVALRDFGAPAIARFRGEWGALAEAERGDARQAPWFRSLVRALRDEVKTQKALAGLEGGEAALLRAHDLVALGQYLGVRSELPNLDDIGTPATGGGDSAPVATQAATAPASTHAAATPAASQATASAPRATSMAAAPSDSAARTRAHGDAAPASAPAPTGRQWLQAQSDDDLTLQIFAVNHLDRVEQLLAAHPKLALHIVATDGAAPRYRVFHGVFQDEAAARAGFDALPEDVTAAAGGAIVKSFAAVRDDLRAPALRRAAKPAASAGGDGFTLQLFASGSRSNALALVNAFPELSLVLIEVPGDPSPYRVVYGRFPSADAARSAAATLPGDLLARVGDPLPKALAGTGLTLR